MHSRLDDSTTAPRILVLGCRRQLLEAARALGVRAVVVAGPWERDNCGSLLGLAHDVVDVDNVTQTDTVLAGLRRSGYGQDAFGGIVAASDEYVGVVAFLEYFLRGEHARSHPWSALTWRDKFLQKEAVYSAGVTVARSQFIADIHAPLPHLDVPFPAVVKPAAGAGAAHTSVVRDTDDLRAALELAGKRTTKRTFVVEEFIDATEYQVDAVVHKGHVLFVSAARYLVNPLESLDGRIGRAATVDPAEDPELYRTLREMVGRSAAALGVVSSVLHVEAFLRSDGTWVFGECGVRLGGCFTRELVNAKYGIDLAAVEIQLSMGVQPDLKENRAPGVYCRVFLPTREGLLRRALTREELVARPEVCEAEIRYPMGSVLPPPDTNAVTGLGEAVVVGKDLQDADRRAVDIAEWHLSVLDVEPVGSSPMRSW
ncbi:acetyl-CoA carboxylase biotin carboxylase subunit family protein [Streptomyces sp. NPDC090029]|uniref:ATP-grasp domain-containing protein n=1 Tax=Streptomyces sp. NPDC090029 TaxID=3365924 RepID=UPI00380E5767